MHDILKALEKENPSIGILGLGKSNVGVVQYLRRKKPDVRLTVRSDVYVDASALMPDAVFVGDRALSDITEDVLFLSPSVKRNRPKLIEATKNGVVLSSDAELFFELYDAPCFCVTGSDGKSTVTKLISELLTTSGTKATPCGNFGKSLSSILDTDVLPVAELSSFQLSHLVPCSSRAVITNVTPNHLDWHTSLEEYVLAKMNVTKNTEKVIFDSDCDILKTQFLEREVFAKTSLTDSCDKLRANGGAENYLSYDNGIIYVNSSPFANVTNAKKQEPYTIRNFLLAAAASLDIVSSTDIERVFTSFTGLPHRAEIFFEHNRIRFADSSIDSTPDRTIRTLSALDRNTVAIIGGKGKNLPLDALASALPFLTKGAVLMGEVGYEISEILESCESGFTFVKASDMRDAVLKAVGIADCSGTVILSPAATSFDSYKNFEERGNDFKNIVLSLYKTI